MADHFARNKPNWATGMPRAQMKERVAERSKVALEMRANGETFKAIGKALECSGQNAKVIWRKALKRSAAS